MDNLQNEIPGQEPINDVDSQNDEAVKEERMPEEFDEEVPADSHVEDKNEPNKTFLPDYPAHPFWVKDRRNQFQK